MASAASRRIVAGGALALLAAGGVLLWLRPPAERTRAARQGAPSTVESNGVVHELTAVKPDAPAARGLEASARVPLEPAPEPEPAEERPVPAERLVTGVVLDCHGAPLEGVGVLAGGAREVSDADGAVRFEGFWPGQGVELRVDPETLPEGYLPTAWQRDDGVALLHGAEDARWGRAGVPFVLQLSTGTVVRGLASGPGGAPLAQVQVAFVRRRVDGSRDAGTAVQTDEDGRFETAALPAGSWEAQVRGGFAPYAARPEPVPFELRCGQAEAALELRFDQGLGEALLVGQAVLPEGRRRAMLVLGLWRAEPGLTAETRSDFAPACSGPVDATNSFVFIDLAPGDYLLGQVEVPSTGGAIWIPAVDLLPVHVADGDNEVEWVAECASIGALGITLESRHLPAAVTVRRTSAHRPGDWLRDYEQHGTRLDLAEIPAGELQVELSGRDLRTAARVLLEPGALVELRVVEGRLVELP